MQGGYFKTKRVHIFVNGHAQSKAFYIHPRCRLGWNAILDCFSKTLKPYFGAIRVLRSIDGRRVIESFSDLQHDGKYVACGLEAFRNIKGGYITSLEIHTKSKTSEYYPTDILSPDEQKKYPCLIETMRKGRTIIYVFANGKRSDPKKVVLIKSDYEAWDIILTHIGNILDIPEGVKGLYTVFGQPLCSPHEIQHGGYYVAIPFNASFKTMKYLTSQRSKSYHESSPMVTKDVYISASKTCPTMDGSPIRKRRRSKTTKVKDNFEETVPDTMDNLEHRVRIEGNAIRRKEGKRKWDTDDKYKGFMKKRLTGYPGNLFFGASDRRETLETLNEQQLTADYIFRGSRRSDQDTDVKFHGNKVHIDSFSQKEAHTQTNTLFFEATYDKDNAIFLNRRRYYLVPEREMHKFGESDRSEWYTELFSDLSKKPPPEFTEEEKKEIELIAGAMVGVIIQVSEKIANRSVFGRESEMSDAVDGKLSLIPDTLQPRSTSKESQGNASQSSRQTSIMSKDKSLRLSVPIGRHSTNKTLVVEPKKEPSTQLLDSSSLLQSLDKEFSPLTPSHTLETNLDELHFLQSIEDGDGLNRQTSSLLKHLKKDSVGFSSDELKPLIKAGEINGNIPEIYLEQNIEVTMEEEEESDEWKKLDILEDIGIIAEDEVETDEDLELLLDEEEVEEYDEGIPSDGYATSDFGKQYEDETDFSESYGEFEDDFERYGSEECEEGDDDDDDVPYCQRYYDYMRAQMRAAELAHAKNAYKKESVEVENTNEPQSHQEHEKKLTAFSDTVVEYDEDETDKKNSEDDGGIDIAEQEGPDEEVMIEETHGKVETSSNQVEIDEANGKLQPDHEEQVISLLPPVDDIHGRKSQAVPVELRIAELDIPYVKPKSFAGSLEDRRITLNTWDHSVEKVLKNKFEDEITKVGDQPTQYTSDQMVKGEGQEMDNKEVTNEEWPEKDIEEERRSLMNFFRLRIEHALNENLKDSQEHSV